MQGRPGKDMVEIKENAPELKWHHCFMCPNKVRCRNEHVERGSKKCLNLLRLLQKKGKT